MRKRSLTCLVLGLGLALTPVMYVKADEWEENTILYEDDAWYDISEWFDGNDFNPTDEAAGRIDNETYDLNEDIGTDQDNDIDWSTGYYGFYDDDRDNDWYYDYSDYAVNDWYDDDEDGIYEYSSQYYDTDNDGVYESYATFYDTDGDGIYDDTNYYYFGNDSNQKSTESKRDAVRQQKDRSSQVTQLSGTVQAVKQVRDKKGFNIVVRLKNSNSDQQVPVDLGPKDELFNLPQVGDQLTVTGPRMKVGETVIVLAQKMEANGKQEMISRSDRSLTGKVVSTKRMKISGVEHQFAKMRTDDSTHFLVDLGPADSLNVNLTENTQATVSGPAIQIKDRRLLKAQSITVDDKTFKIRPANKMDNRTAFNR